jgi:hypothetical protein
VRLDLLLEGRDLLLGEADGIGAGDEAARRRILAGDPEQRPGGPPVGDGGPSRAALPATAFSTGRDPRD